MRNRLSGRCSPRGLHGLRYIFEVVDDAADVRISGWFNGASLVNDDGAIDEFVRKLDEGDDGRSEAGGFHNVKWDRELNIVESKVIDEAPHAN